MVRRGDTERRIAITHSVPGSKSNIGTTSARFGTTCGTTRIVMKPLSTLLWHDVTTCTPGRPPSGGADAETRRRETGRWRWICSRISINYQLTNFQPSSMTTSGNLHTTSTTPALRNSSTRCSRLWTLDLGLLARRRIADNLGHGLRSSNRAGDTRPA